MLRMAFDGKNKAQDLEEIIEQKVQEEVERRLNNFKDRSSQENQKLDRREFLKKAGMGAAGLAALGLSPAASEVIIDDNQGLRMANGDIDLNNQNITAVNRINGYEISDFLNSGGGEFKLCGNNYSASLNMDSAFLHFRKIARSSSQTVTAHLGLTSNIKINRVNTNMGFFEQNSAILHYEDSSGNSQTKTYGNADIDIIRGNDFPSDAYLIKIEFDVDQDYNNGTNQGWGFEAWAEVR